MNQGNEKCNTGGRVAYAKKSPVIALMKILIKGLSWIWMKMGHVYKTISVGRRQIFVLIFLFTIINSLFFPFPIDALSGRQVLILDIPRFDLAEISQQYPELMKLVKNSSVGIMTAPFPDPLTFEKIYLGFNSGSQIKTSPQSYSFFNAREEINGLPAGNIYRNNTGMEAPADGAVCLEFPIITEQNDCLARSNLGVFGALLHKKGIPTAVIGNADADVLNRYAAAMIMDQNGIVDFGAIGAETLIQDPLFPYGHRTDPGKIVQYWNTFRLKKPVTVITLGDFERIERYRANLSPDRWKYYRELTLQRYDSLMGQLISQLDLKQTLLIVFTALSPENDSRLAWVIITGPGLGAGLLYSNSIRKPGITTCYDLPATILNFLNIKSKGVYNGYPLRTVGGDWRTVIAEQSAININYKVRWPLLSIYAYILIGLFFLAILSLIFNLQYKLYQWVIKGYLFLLTFPAIFLVEALIDPLDWPSIAGWTLGLAEVVYLVLFITSGRDLFRTAGAISLFTVGLVLIDVLFNGYCELKSFLGYSAVAGARFYGIGNEYLGVLLGAYIVAFSIYHDKIKRYHSQILWTTVFFITILIIHPNFGSSIGGGITALIGLGITTYLWLDHRVRFKEIICLAGSLIIMLLLIGIWDYYFNKSSMTHLGQMISFIAKNGFKTFGEIAVRKLQLNLRLINYSIWGQILVVLLAVIPLLYKKPPVFVAELLTKYPYIFRGFLGLTITAIVALLIKDSGIVSVATMFIFGINMLLLVFSKEWANRMDKIDGVKR